MIYLYVSNEKKNEIKYDGKDKYIKININDVNKHYVFEEYIFVIREDQLGLIPCNKATKHIIMKSCTNQRQVVKKVGACHKLYNKVYFV